MSVGIIDSIKLNEGINILYHQVGIGSKTQGIKHISLQAIHSEPATNSNFSFPLISRLFQPQLSSPPFYLCISNPNQHPMNPYNLIFFINEQEEAIKGDHPRRLRVPNPSLSVGKTSLLNAYGSTHSATSIKNSCNPTRPPSVLTSWRSRSS